MSDKLIHFRHIRHKLPIHAAKLFMHSMILSHLSHCATIWSQASVTMCETGCEGFSYKKYQEITTTVPL